MFTGIVEEVGTIDQLSQQGELQRACISATKILQGTQIGDSIAVSGVCLTVVELHPQGFSVELTRETLQCTAARWAVGQQVNLERSLSLGSRLGGHMVTGHVDGQAQVVRVQRVTGAWNVWLEAPTGLAHYIALKGSVALDGVSLTVAGVEGRRFWVTLIPHTLEQTTLHTLVEGDWVNLEVDLLARYIARLMDLRGGSHA